MEICLLVQNIMPLQYYSITVFEKQKRWVRSVLPVKNHKKLSNEPQKTFLKTVKL